MRDVGVDEYIELPLLENFTFLIQCLYPRNIGLTQDAL